MPYWELVRSSFHIAWKHRYLWLLALFSGETGSGSFNFTFPPSGSSGSTPHAPDFTGASVQVTHWTSTHTALLAEVGALLVLFAVLLFLLSAICEGALVRAAAEHDAERPFKLGTAWLTGRQTMGRVVRLRLLVLALWAPVVLVLGGLFVGAFAAIYLNNVGVGLVLLVACLIAFIPAAVYAVYISLLQTLGTRAAVLEQVGAVEGLRRGHRLIRRRLGRVLLVWLLAFAVAVVATLALGCAAAIVLLPLALGVMLSGNLLVVAGATVLALVIALPVFGFLGAQGSTYWTLAFRRLDLDSPPAFILEPQPPRPLPGTP